MKRRAQVLLAAVSGAWLLLFGVLGTRHEAQVAHHVDARSGLAFHAASLVGDHTSHQSDIHSRTVGSDADACGVVTVLHQAASAAFAAPTLVRGRQHMRAIAAVSVRETHASRCVYRLAPKTSPPIAA